jgi:hypothetical protein
MDCTRTQALLASGLFARAAPAPYPPATNQGPMYVGDPTSGAVRQVILNRNSNPNPILSLSPN